MGEQQIRGDSEAGGSEGGSDAVMEVRDDLIPALAGIPGFMREPLADLVSRSKSTSRDATAGGKPFMEECGFFMFVATDWTPGLGWQGSIRYQHMTNTSKREGGFIMDNDEVAAVLSEALVKREQVVEAVCSRHGWDESTPWVVAFWEHAMAQWEIQHEGISWTQQQRSDAIFGLLREEQLDMAQGWDKKALSYLAISSDRENEFLSGPRLSAAEWLMIRGIGVLAGLGHSHPSGNADLSPEDYLTTSIIEHWKKVFQARFVYLGQKKDSVLEVSRSVGNWIYGMQERVELFDPAVAALGANLNPGTWRDAPRAGRGPGLAGKPGTINNFRFIGSSTISRYDGRGKRGEWTGPF